MSYPKLSALIILFVMLCVSAQEMKQFTFKTDNSFLLKELTAIVQEKDGKVIFEMIPPQIFENEKFKDLDLQKGDEILFVNGLKINSLEDVRTAYDSIKVGEKIKLGIKRDQERFFASLIKEETQDGGGRIMIMGGGDGSFHSENGKVMIDGKEVNIDSLKKEGKFKVVPMNKKKKN